VAHDEFTKIEFNKIKADRDIVIYDTKGFLDREMVDGRL